VAELISDFRCGAAGDDATGLLPEKINGISHREHRGHRENTLDSIQWTSVHAKKPLILTQHSNAMFQLRTCN
jgi:hypothetical protein